MRKIMLFLLALVLMISLSSAANFDNAKETRINNNIEIIEELRSYPIIKIQDWFGFGEDIAEMYIQDHTSICISKCNSEIKIKLLEEASLVDKVLFYKIGLDGVKTQTEIRSYQIYIQEGFNEKEIIDYEKICNDLGTYSNGSTIQSCQFIESGKHIEQVPNWIPYNLGDKMPIGEYTIKIEGEKKPEHIIDWVIETNGVLTSEWAVWGSGSFGTGNIFYWNFINSRTENKTNAAPAGGSGVSIVTGGINNNASSHAGGGSNIEYNSSQWYTGLQNRTLNFWMKTSATGGGIMMLDNAGANPFEKMYLQGSALKIYILDSDDNVLPIDTDVSAYLNNNWHMFTIVKNTTTWSLFVDGSSIYSQATTATLDLNNRRLRIGVDDTSSFSGLIDEIGIWNITLSSSEVSSLYNSGAGTFYPFSSNQVILNSPANNFVSSSSTVSFNVSAVANGLVNASLLINSTGTFKINQTTLLTGTSNSTNWSLTLADGTYLFAGQACDIDGDCGLTANRTFTVDTSSPVLEIVYPNGTIPIGSVGQNITINYTVSDSSIQSCWFNYGNVNYTVTCGRNGSIILTEQKNLTFYSNDSAGNLNSKFTSWNYSIFINSFEYNPSAFSNNLETFKVNTTIANGFSVNQVNITYNNTRYIAGASTIGPNTIFTRTITTPLVSGQRNVTFNWTFGTSSGNLVSLSNNQSITPLLIDNCTTNTYQILNYTLYDEDSRVLLNPATANITANYLVKLSTDFSGQSYTSYANTTSSNPIRICISSPLVNGTNYRLDSDVQFSASGKVTEYHIIENVSISNNTIPLAYSLYDLATTSSQEFLITFKDSNYNVVEGALIELDRQYLGIGQFLPVEISRTDTDGKTIGHFVLNDQVYTIYVRKNGQLLATYTNVRVYCASSTTDCKLNLNQAGSSANPSSFKNYRGVMYKPYYNTSSRIYSLEYVVNDGSSKLFNLTLYKYDNYGNNSLCSTQVTSFSGTITCNVPGSYNGTAIAKAYVDGQLLLTDSFKVAALSDSESNPIRYFLAFIVIVTLPLLAASSGVMSLVFFIVGLVFVALLQLVDFGGLIGASSALMWLMIAAIVLIWKASKGREDA